MKSVYLFIYLFVYLFIYLFCAQAEFFASTYDSEKEIFAYFSESQVIF